MTPAIAAAAVLLLTACSGPAGDSATGTPAGPDADVVAGPDTPVSAPAAPAEPSLAGPLADPDDPCEAKRFQHFVGKPWTIVGTPPPNRTWRVHSTTDAVTEDYNPARMNVMWDADTGLVVSVKCG